MNNVIWPDFSGPSSKGRVMGKEPEYNAGDHVIWTTTAFGKIPGVVESIYNPDNNARTTRYKIKLDAAKCPEEYKPDRIVYAFGDKLLEGKKPTTKRAPAPAKAAKKAPAKPTTSGQASMAPEFSAAPLEATA